MYFCFRWVRFSLSHMKNKNVQNVYSATVMGAHAEKRFSIFFICHPVESVDKLAFSVLKSPPFLLGIFGRW